MIMRTKKLFMFGVMALCSMTAFGQRADIPAIVFQNEVDAQGKVTQTAIPVAPSQVAPTLSLMAAQQKAEEESMPMTTEKVNGVETVRRMTPSEAEQYRLRVARRTSDNQIFTAYTDEGQAMTFKVLDESAKTCQVGVGEGDGAGVDDAAIDRTYAGPITIPAEAKGYKVVQIGNGAFFGCYSLTALNMPNTIQKINFCALNGCSSLTTLAFPASLEEVYQWFAAGCSGLESITVDAANPTFTDGGANALINTTTNELRLGCKNTVIPDYVEQIVGGAFEDCYGLTAIHIPARVSWIHSQAFVYCTGVTSVTVDASNTNYTDGGCNAIITGSTLVFGCRNTVIPETITYIGSQAFNGQPIQKITIPAGVTNIGWVAFAACNQLTEVICKATTPPTIGANDYAFNGAYDRATLYVPQGTKEAYQEAVEWSKFTTITELDPSGNPVVDETEFTDLTKEGVEMKFKVLDTAAKTCQVGFLVSGGSYSSDNACVATTTTGTVTIPSQIRGYKVVGIGSAAFYGVSQIENVVIPNTVEYINDFAFAFTNSMKTLALPASVTTLTNYALAHATGRTAMTVDAANPVFESQNNGIIEKATATLVGGCATTVIPSTVKAIGHAAFYGCQDAKSFEIPGSVESFGAQSFSYMNNLERLNITGSALFDSRNNCGAIIETATDRMVKAGGKMFIPATVKTIGKRVLEGNNLLTTLEIPAGVTDIMTGAFYYCRNLYQVTSYIIGPFVLPEDAICCSHNVYPEYLYVPAGCKEKYMAIEVWNKFKNIEELGSETTVELDPLPENTSTFSSSMTGSTSLSGTTVDNIYFTLKSSNGDGYDETKGCVVVRTTMSDADVEALDMSLVGTPAFDAMFTGMTFFVKAGRGSITVDMQSLGGYSLGVKIGGGAVVKVQHADRNTVVINYNVAEDTYVLLYARNPDGSAPAMRAALDDDAEIGLEVYAVGWNHTGDYDPTGITTTNFTNDMNNAGTLYNLDGRRLTESTKGVVIIRNNQGESKKVVVK